MRAVARWIYRGSHLENSLPESAVTKRNVDTSNEPVMDVYRKTRVWNMSTRIVSTCIIEHSLKKKEEKKKKESLLFSATSMKYSKVFSFLSQSSAANRVVWGVLDTFVKVNQIQIVSPFSVSRSLSMPPADLTQIHHTFNSISILAHSLLSHIKSSYNSSALAAIYICHSVWDSLQAPNSISRCFY